MNYVVSHWSAAWPVLVCYAAITAVHLTGLRRLTVAGWTPRDALASDQAKGRRREAVIFHLGLLTACLALVSPIVYWSGKYIWVRSVQDLALGVVAPSLIVLGAPWLALRQGLPRAPAQRPDDEPVLGNGHAAVVRVRWWLAWPVGVTAAFNIVWLGWHVPALYDLTVRDAVAGYAESVMFLGAGILFWLQLIGSCPWSPRSSPLRRLALLTGTIAADMLLGIVLVFGTGLVYAAYRGSAHHLLAAVADQQVGGGVLWMGALPSFMVAAVALLNAWLKNDESDDLSADLDRLSGQRPAGAWSGGSAWPARPGYRRRTI